MIIEITILYFGCLLFGLLGNKLTNGSVYLFEHDPESMLRRFGVRSIQRLERIFGLHSQIVKGQDRYLLIGILEGYVLFLVIGVSLSFLRKLA